MVHSHQLIHFYNDIYNHMHVVSICCTCSHALRLMTGHASTAASSPLLPASCQSCTYRHAGAGQAMMLLPAVLTAKMVVKARAPTLQQLAGEHAAGCGAVCRAAQRGPTDMHAARAGGVVQMVLVTCLAVALLLRHGSDADFRLLLRRGLPAGWTAARGAVLATLPLRQLQQRVAPALAAIARALAAAPERHSAAAGTAMEQCTKILLEVRQVFALYKKHGLHTKRHTMLMSVYRNGRQASTFQEMTYQQMYVALISAQFTDSVVCCGHNAGLWRSQAGNAECSTSCRCKQGWFGQQHNGWRQCAAQCSAT